MLDLLQLKTLLIQNPELAQYKKEAKTLLKELKKQQNNKISPSFDPAGNGRWKENDISLMHCQEMVAKKYGYNNWHHLHQTIKNVYLGKVKNDNIIRTKLYTRPYDDAYWIGQDLNKQNLWMREKSLNTHLLHFGNMPTNFLNNMVNEAIRAKNNIAYIDSSHNNFTYDSFVKIIKQNNLEQKLYVLDFRFNKEGHSDSIAGLFDSQLSSGLLTEIIIRTIDTSEGWHMWTGRAISLLSAALLLMKYLKENNIINQQDLYTFEGVTKFIQLDYLIQYSKDENIPEHIQNGLKAYLKSLPSYDPMKQQQPEVVMEQHGYLQMQLSHPLRTIFEYGGNTFKQGSPDINTILQDKILFVRLPHIEYNGRYQRHAEMIHRMVGGLLKSFLAMSLGGILSDNSTDTHIKPTKKTWFFNNLSGQLGFAVVPAQARSLGIKLVHHYDSKTRMLELLNKEEALSLLANCNTLLYSETNNEETQKLIDFNVMRLNQDYYHFIYAEKPSLAELSSGEYVIQHQNIIEKIKIQTSL